MEEAGLKPRIEEAVKLVAKLGQDKLLFTETLMQRKNLHFRMAHGSKSLATEKRLLKEIKGSQKQEEEEEEESFALFCTQCEADLAYVTENLKGTTDYTKHSRYPNWWWYIARHEMKWWLQHQMPFLISKENITDRGGEIRDLECRIERCEVVLLKKADKEETANNITTNASSTLVLITELQLL
ncbi:uncharacterized protein LOC126785477 isoform X2 [Argentina anserina]|uniref:uncharacterized protein LOC126785477 isoform X2 n=1 Tax=Argentina anserina TaxID=57926 RepID=UPI0021764B96|nr:uncharacterized protein LOC126785477 isoform X2 [Potentilla anserina]